jgi:2-polyprenyl-3-methyl-5-hydroxy-6-metoxy-1,4-benzoquinol methylase
MSTPTSKEMGRLTARLKEIWIAGDDDRFSRYLEGGAREFYERLTIAPGCHLLDVACGSSQLALMAAKDCIEVTGVDIAGNLVGRARARTQAEGLDGADWEPGLHHIVSVTIRTSKCERSGFYRLLSKGA